MMNAISGFGSTDVQRFDSQSMINKARENIQAADADNNGAISFAEAEASVKEYGGPGEMLNKMFDKADANGDGELSEQEQQQMFNHVEEQMAKLKSMMTPADNAGQGGFNQSRHDSFQSLLNSLTAEDDEESVSSNYLNQVTGSYSRQQQSPIDIMA